MKFLLSFLLPSVLFAVDCPPLYKNLFGTKCYRYLTDQPRTWIDSRHVCLQDGGDLVSIHSQEENDVLYNSMDDIMSTKWIGLYATETTGPSSWSDGTAIDYTDYMPGKDCVNGSAGGDGGYAIVVDNPLFDGTWRCFLADGHGQALCQIKAIDTNGHCDDESYQYSGEVGGCIRVQSTPNSWNNAEAACVQDGAHLVSIHSKQANDFLRQLALSNSFSNDFLIGAKSDGDGNRWSDGTPFDFTNFEEGMPNTNFGQCTSLAIQDDNGQWTTIQCGLTRLPYICSKPVLFVVNCPLGYKNLFGTKCYRYVTDQPRTWTDARHICLLEGGDLVSIHSQEENDVLYEFMEDKYSTKWIGLFATQTEGASSWSDGTPIDYTHYMVGKDCANGSPLGDGAIGMVVDDPFDDGLWRCFLAGERNQAICQINGIVANASSN